MALIIGGATALSAQEGAIPVFPIANTEIDLQSLTQPGTPFNKVGRRFAMLGYESGTFEAWAYPVKLFRNVQLSFLTASSTRPIAGSDIVRTMLVTPAATTLVYTYQSFTIRATWVAAIDQPCGMILLQIDSSEPLTIVCGFQPVLQPMWPAGIGGQYAYWDDNNKYYLISEPTRQNHAFIGSPAASGVSYTPAHMLSDVPNEFKIEISDPASVREKFIPIYMAGGKGVRDSLRTAYRRMVADPRELYERARQHYEQLLANTLKITTPVASINLAFAWSKISLDNLMVDNPDLGRGMVAGLASSGTSGRPGFGWFFGGDAYINSFALNSYGNYAAVRDALTFTQKWQRHDGKMAHELSQAAGYLDWFGKYPYGYIHGDTTPFYIVAMYDYFNCTGDSFFVRTSWKSLCRAYQWCLTTDENRDGLMDNTKAGLGSVEYGALTGLRTDILLGALSVRMSFCMQELAKVVGDRKLAAEADRLYRTANSVFDSKFWDSATGIYSNAFNDQNEHVLEISPWIAFTAVVDVGDSAHVLASLQKLSSAELTTDWGVRSISNKSKLYSPLNYNYGAVWPFLTGYVALAQYNQGMSLQAFGNITAVTDHFFDNNIGHVTEVFSGSNNIWPQEAVSQQGFSATGLALPLVRGLLGLTASVPGKLVRFAPQLPVNWPVVRAQNYCIGDATFSFDYQKESDGVKIIIDQVKGMGFDAMIAPSFDLGTKIERMLLDGKPVPFKVVNHPQSVQPMLKFVISRPQHLIQIEYAPGPELLPPARDSRTGDPDHGLKIISTSVNKNQLTIDIEGLVGQGYSLQLLHPERVAAVEGAILSGGELKWTMPEGPSGSFINHNLVIILTH